MTPEGYTLGPLLGEGATSQVYAAVGPDGAVALKLLRGDDAEALARMEREAHLMLGVRHPAIPRIHAAGPGWIAMERVSGETLETRLMRGPLSGPAARELVRELCSALAAAHATGVLHRDLAPKNVMVGPTRLIDFGLGRGTGDRQLTQSQTMLGTPAFLAPECWFGAPATVASDVFGLGAVWYAALTGQGPYADGAPGAVPLPAGADPLLGRMLALEPKERPSLNEVDAALSQVGGLFRWALALLPLVALMAWPGGPLQAVRLSGWGVWPGAVLAAALWVWPGWSREGGLGRPAVLALGWLGALIGFAVTVQFAVGLEPDAAWRTLRVGLAESLANIWVVGWLGASGARGSPGAGWLGLLASAGAVLLGVPSAVVPILLAQSGAKDAAILAASAVLAGFEAQALMALVDAPLEAREGPWMHRVGLWAVLGVGLAPVGWTRAMWPAFVGPLGFGIGVWSVSQPVAVSLERREWTRWGLPVCADGAEVLSADAVERVRMGERVEGLCVPGGAGGRQGVVLTEDLRRAGTGLAR